MLKIYANVSEINAVCVIVIVERGKKRKSFFKYFLMQTKP